MTVFVAVLFIVLQITNERNNYQITYNVAQTVHNEIRCPGHPGMIYTLCITACIVHLFALEIIVQIVFDILPQPTDIQW